MFVSVFNITNVFHNVLFWITMEAFLLYQIISGIGNFLYFRFKGNYFLIAGLGKKIYSCQLSTDTTQKGQSCTILTRKKKHCLYAVDKTRLLGPGCSNAGRRYPPDKSQPAILTVEPRSNEGPRDWQNMFAITRFSLYRGSFR